MVLDIRLGVKQTAGAQVLFYWRMRLLETPRSEPGRTNFKQVAIVFSEGGAERGDTEIVPEAQGRNLVRFQDTLLSYRKVLNYSVNNS